MTSPKYPSVAIIVLNWRQPQLTVKTVNSLLEIKHPKFDYQIFLTDNDTDDSNFIQFNKQYGTEPRVTLIHTASNLGFTGGNNFTLKIALKGNFTHFLLINNDVLVDREFLYFLLQRSHRLPTPSILGPKIYFARGYEYHSNRYTDKQKGRVVWSAGGRIDWPNILGSNIGVDEVDEGQFNRFTSCLDFISGCAMLIDRHIIEKIGLLDDNYFMYLEDADYCQRALRAGFTIGFEPDSIIWHVSSGSSKIGSHLQDYFINRNRLIFGFKYASLHTKMALTKEAFSFLVGKNTWKRKAVIDFFTHKWGKGSWR